MRCSLHRIFLLFGLCLCSAYAQQIDSTIARELGLIGPGAKEFSDTRIASPLGLSTSGSGTRLIEMNVGKMHELVFPEQGTLKIKGEYRDAFDFLNVNNSLFIQPKKTIDDDAVGVFVLNHSKQSYVLNLRTVNYEVGGGAIVFGRPVADQIIEQAQPSIKRLPVPGRPSLAGGQYDDYVRLVAFAARSAYAPDRLLDPPKGVREILLPGNVKKLPALLRENRIYARLLSSWQWKALTVTVIELKNTGKEPLWLTPDLVRGAFLGKSFQHNRLGTHETDRYSALYVLSNKPFVNALEMSQVSH